MNQPLLVFFVPLKQNEFFFASRWFQCRTECDILNFFHWIFFSVDFFVVFSLFFLLFDYFYLFSAPFLLLFCSCFQLIFIFHTFLNISDLFLSDLDFSIRFEIFSTIFNHFHIFFNYFWPFSPFPNIFIIFNGKFPQSCHRNGLSNLLTDYPLNLIPNCLRKLLYESSDTPDRRYPKPYLKPSSNIHRRLPNVVSFTSSPKPFLFIFPKFHWNFI